MSLIIHIRACNFFGGPEKQIVNHIKTNTKFEHKVLSFIENNAHNELIERCRKDNISTITISTKSSFEISSILKLRRIFKQEKPRLLCSHGYKPTLLSLIAKIGLNIPLIVFLRGHTSENLKVKLFETIELKATRFATGMISVSEGYAKYLLGKGIPLTKLSVVQNAIGFNPAKLTKREMEEKKEELGYKNTDFLIATAGRLSPEKAQSDLIHAFSAIMNKFPNAKLLLLGDGPLHKELSNLIRKNNIPSARLLGFRKDIHEIMSVIDLFVLPSLSEGLPNVVLEAFSCGKPVVATNVGGTPEVVDHNHNGLLVPPGNVEALVEALETCISNPTLLTKMGNAGYEKVKNNFSVETQNLRLENIYSKTISQNQI